MNEEEHNDAEGTASQATGQSQDAAQGVAEEDTGAEEAGDLLEPSPEDVLRTELDQAHMLAEKHKDEALRAMAELDNVRKRAERDVESAHKFGIEKFVTELLPVKDSMDLGFDAANSAEDIDALREGMSLTLKMFETALEKRGVAELNPTGDVFDPEFHQAMMMEASIEAEPGTVLRVMQKGYALNDRLIRPAMVVVAKKADDES